MLCNPVRNEVFFHRQPIAAQEIENAISAINECQKCQLRYGGKPPSIIKRINLRKTDFIIDKGSVVENI